MKAAYRYEKKPSSRSSRKRKAGRARKTKLVSVEDFDWLDGFDFVEVSQSDQRRLISLFYLDVLKAPPPEEWRGEGGTVSQIVSALNLTKDQRKKVIRVIAKTHQCLTVGKE